MSRHSLAIVTTHPIQYHAPWFRALGAHPDIDLHVFFCHRATPQEQGKSGFGVEFDWDVSLLDGYMHHFLRNQASDPTVNSFAGLDTPEVKGIITEGKFDAVLVNGWYYKSAWQAIRACWRTQTPVMVRSDSHLYTKRTIPKRVLKSVLYSSLIPKFDACLAVGQWSKDYYVRYGASPERIFFVPHVVDEAWFGGEYSKWMPQRSKLRSRWRLDDEHILFMFAAKFIEKKRPADFVRGIARAARANSKVVGLMVGDGPLRPACEDLAGHLGAPIHFAGFLNQSEIPRAYMACDVLVLPSNSEETWGLVVNEAMSFGRPCIVSDQAGCGPDLVIPGTTGDAFQMGNIDALSKLLLCYEADRQRVKEMGCQAKKRLSEYSITAAVEGVRQAIVAVTQNSTWN